MSNAVRKLIKKGREVAKALTEAIKRDYPVDSEISWMRGRNVQTGIVLFYSTGTRLKVKSQSSFKEYWIHIHDVYDAKGCVGAW